MRRWGISFLLLTLLLSGCGGQSAVPAAAPDGASAPERPAVEAEDEAFFFRVVRGAFLLRRKTLVNSLSAALPEWGKERVQAAMETCGLSLTVRGEKLTLEDFARLAAALAEERRSLS